MDTNGRLDLVQGTTDRSHLVVVDVNWSTWVPNEDNLQRYASFLNRLVRPKVGGPVWVSLDCGPAERRLDELLLDRADGPGSDHLAMAYRPYHLLKERARERPPGSPPLGAWSRGTAADWVLELIEEGLSSCVKVAEATAGVRAQERFLLPQLNLFTCRVFLTQQHLRELLDPVPLLETPPYYASIDIRFEHHVNRYRCYVSMILWTYWPMSARHAPPQHGEPRPLTSYSHGDLAAVRKKLDRQIRKQWRTVFEDYFDAYTLRLFDRQYLSPSFYVLMPEKERVGAPSGYLDTRQERITNDLSRLLLDAGDYRERTVAASVVGARTVVLRRFLSVDADDLPCYLLLTSSPPDASGEDELRELVVLLTALEGIAAARLFDIETHVEGDENLLRLYATVADEGGALWDALAMHLPLARRGTMAKAHRSISLVHQGLLQGIADLDAISTSTTSWAEQLDLTVEDLRRRFDRKAGEVRSGGEWGLRTSFGELGHFDRVKRKAQSCAQQATDVRDTYHSLLEAIGRSFDERRARESDALEVSSFRLGRVLGLLAVLTVAEVLGSLQLVAGDGPQLISQVGVATMVVVGIIGVYIMFEVVRASLAAWRVGGLSSSDEFLERYERLRAFLAQASTATLRDALKSDPRPDSTWEKRDLELSAAFATLWDDVARRSGEQRNARQKVDLDVLQQWVEEWLVQALLATERPRAFGQFHLPRLACLYRFLAHHFDRPDQPISLLSQFELSATLTETCGLRQDTIDDIEAWGVGLRNTGAVELLERVTDLGIRVPGEGNHLEVYQREDGAFALQEVDGRPSSRPVLG